MQTVHAAYGSPMLITDHLCQLRTILAIYRLFVLLMDCWCCLQIVCATYESSCHLQIVYAAYK